MRTFRFVLSCLFIGFLFFSCDSDAEGGELLNSIDEASDSSEGFSTTSDGNGSGNGGEAGLVTAAEWNDLDNWTFWVELLKTEEFSNKPDLWNFYNLNRISVVITNGAGVAVNDLSVRLESNGTIVWEGKTDNLGSAELFVGLRQRVDISSTEEYTLFVENEAMTGPIKLFADGVNEFVYNESVAESDKVELAFIVDATGSMGDELEFLKKDLLSVISKVEQDAPNLDIMTASVFYRDVEDDYLVKHSGFTSNTKTTLDFITEQRADGGGDFPEAVHTALNTALSELQWSTSAKTRIAFLLLDAPPHNQTNVIGELQNAIMDAARKGIKIIPITASGIDKETEYLMRSFCIATNGTYVFITNDSGIGNDHLEASVGEYQVEKLNDLMVRLIRKYSE